MSKSCALCLSLFDPTSNRQKFCLDCKQESRRNNGRAFADKLRKEGNAESYNRAANLKTTYGINPGQFDLMLEQQDNKCAICETDKPGGRYSQWHIDHDHQTKKIRGLLCHSCNLGIGIFEEDIERLEAAIQYLRKHG